MPTLLPIMPLLLFLLLGPTATAQCTPQWLPGDAIPQPSGAITSLVTWDPDGSGPSPLGLVAGGSFRVGTGGNTNTALHDGTRWNHLGFLPGYVHRLANWNGQLVAITAINQVESVMLWDGTTWQAIGSIAGAGSFYGYARAMTTYNGDLVVAGSFGSISGVAANGIARWNGSTWAPLGSGVSSGYVRSLQQFGSVLYVGGSFTSAGGIATTNLAVWNGSGWAATATVNGTVEAMAVRTGLAITQQQLHIAGNFTAVGTVAAQHVARFGSSTGLWTALGAGLPGTTCTALFGRNSGVNSFELTATVDSPGILQKVWRWNGTAWSNVGLVSGPSGDVSPTCLTYFGGQYVLGLADAYLNVRRFDADGEWTPLHGDGIAGRVRAIDTGGSDLVIAGQFATISGATVNHIARGGPNAWQPLGSGIDPAGQVFALARTSNGDLIAAGSFQTAGGTPVGNIARWNGSSWSSLGTGLNNTVYAILVLANDDVVATGVFAAAGSIATPRIARWNGTTWSPLGTGLSARGNALAIAPNGDVIVGGSFVLAGGIQCNCIASWNGSTWSAFGAGFNSAVSALTLMPNGSLVAGGSFLNSGTTSCPYVAIWNGSAWARPASIFFRPNNDVYTLLALPDGDLVAGGATWDYSVSIPPISVHTNLARLSGTLWSSLKAPGLGIYALAQRADGTLVAGGEFGLDSSVISDNVAQLAPPCPATASSYGAGCSGTGGANTLVATELPWLGGTYRGLATGMPPLGFVVTATGFQALALPIAAILPQGLPGCSALVTPDLLELAIPSAGRVAVQLAIPNTPSLVGAQLRQQVAPFETEVGGAVTAVTSTNALLLTIGVL
jgi:trimeric autotransporter adhesin